jgi:RNA polymerase sigma-70 factor (ECF subfamily)
MHSTQPTSSLPPHDGQSPESVEQFLRLYSAHHNRLLAYILSLVYHRADAEEIFQESSLVLWREFASFRQDADFMPWARAICFNRIREHRRKAARQRAVFSEAMLETLADESASRSKHQDRRAEILDVCIEKLRDEDRHLVRLYYSEGETAESVGRQVNRSVQAIYKAIKRIRRNLFDCTGHTMTAETGR